MFEYFNHREVITLKVVGNEKEGGSGRRQTFPICINFAVVFDCMYFHFRPSKSKINRRNAANFLLRFLFLD